MMGPIHKSNFRRKASKLQMKAQTKDLVARHSRPSKNLRTLSKIQGVKIRVLVKTVIQDQKAATTTKTEKYKHQSLSDLSHLNNSETSL